MKIKIENNLENNSYDFDPRYDVQDFIRNNEEIDAFKNEGGKVVINYEKIVALMIECYKEYLSDNYL